MGYSLVWFGRLLIAAGMAVVFYKVVVYWLKKTNTVLYIWIYRMVYIGAIIATCALLAGKYHGGYEKEWYPQESDEGIIWQGGFGNVEENRIWMIGDESVIMLPIGRELANNDLYVEVNADVFGKQQKLKISMNGTELFNNVVQEGDEIAFLIPKTDFSENMVKLFFEHPDAVSPKQLNQGEDERRLALCIYSIRVKE